MNGASTLRPLTVDGRKSLEKETPDWNIRRKPLSRANIKCQQGYLPTLGLGLGLGFGEGRAEAKSTANNAVDLITGDARDLGGRAVMDISNEDVFRDIRE